MWVTGNSPTSNENCEEIDFRILPSLKDLNEYRHPTFRLSCRGSKPLAKKRSTLQNRYHQHRTQQEPRESAKADIVSWCVQEARLLEKKFDYSEDTVLGGSIVETLARFNRDSNQPENLQRERRHYATNGDEHRNARNDHPKCATYPATRGK